VVTAAGVVPRVADAGGGGGGGGRGGVWGGVVCGGGGGGGGGGEWHDWETIVGIAGKYQM